MWPLRLTLTLSHIREFAPEWLNLKDSVGNTFNQVSVLMVNDDEYPLHLQGLLNVRWHAYLIASNPQ